MKAGNHTRSITSVLNDRLQDDVSLARDIEKTVKTMKRRNEEERKRYSHCEVFAMILKEVTGAYAGRSHDDLLEIARVRYVKYKIRKKEKDALCAQTKKPAPGENRHKRRARLFRESRST